MYYHKKNRYSMRTIRAYHATVYVMLKAEYEVMGWKPLPPNPLQHLSDSTTLEHYAAKGSYNMW